MRRTLLSVGLGLAGLFVGWSGQVIWKDTADELWAIVIVSSVLWALAIAFESAIARLLRPITGREVRRR
jgi:hypothetical protein